MNKPEELSPSETAYHEAGHALVGVAYGANLHYIIHKPRDHCARLSDHKGIIQKAAALLAGSLADHLGNVGTEKPEWFESPSFTWKGASADMHELKLTYEESVLNPNQDDFNGIVHRGKQYAWEVLTANLDALYRLATLVLAEKRIEGSQAIEVLGELVVPTPLGEMTSAPSSPEPESS